MTAVVRHTHVSTIAELAGRDGVVTDGDWIESEDQDPQGDVRLIQLADIGDGEFLNRSQRFLTREKAQELRCTFLHPGDLLIARMPDPLGRACIFPGVGQPAVAAVDIFIWRPGKNGADTSWLMHSVNSPKVRREISTLAGGTTRQRVSGGNLKKLRILAPPPAEQRRIAQRLDNLLSRSRDIGDELDRALRLIARERRALLVAACQGALTKNWRDDYKDVEPATTLVRRTKTPEQPRGGRDAAEGVIRGVAALSVNNPATETPPGWAWVALTRIARQETGHTPSRLHPEWWGGEVPWIGIKDAGTHHGCVIYETLQTTNSAGLANSAARLLPAGTVCLSRTASVGYVLMMGKDMATSQDFATWTCSKALRPKYLMYALMAEGDEIRRFGKGSTHTTIYFPEIRALHICLPPLEEQDEIIRVIDTLFERNKRLNIDVTEARSLVKRLNRAFLNKAVDGALLDCAAKRRHAPHPKTGRGAG